MIELQQVTEADRARLLAWRNLPEVAAFMYTTHEISSAEHDRWFDRTMASDDRRAWTVRLDGRPVGAAFVSEIDRVNRRASWAFYLADPATRGRGVGGAVEVLVLRHAFDDLGLHKLCCEVLSFNSAVVAMHKKFGFREEGVLHDHFLRAGEWVHVHQLAIWADDWHRTRGDLEERLRTRGLIA